MFIGLITPKVARYSNVLLL